VEADAGENPEVSSEFTRIVELTEYKEVRLPHDHISDASGETIWRTYGAQVAVESPSFKTRNEWALTSLGWVGYIPVDADLALRLQPKIPLDNLFRMLEYAYRLKSFSFLPGLTDSGSMGEFYERLANVLSKKVIDRGRKGFYRTYVPIAEELPYVRGQVDLVERLRRPWIVRLPCAYQDHTADIADNQILAWTLLRIARSAACTERVLPTVRFAYRSLQGLAGSEPFRPEACIRRLYNRLNEDYAPMHALCRFFLEHTGPTLDRGEARMLPFLVNMGRLFELFVAEWLKAHLPPRFELAYQERVHIGQDQDLHFDIDMVLYERATHQPVAVLDTKYKADERPHASDLAEIVTYAEAKGCKLALLVYPIPLSPSLDVTVGGIRVRGLTFPLVADIEEGGRSFLTGIAGT
jgi:5-methylcytosine-specific restriction enzyme subunit McrC